MKKTIIDLFEASVRKYGAKTFLLEKRHHKFEPTTYAETREQALEAGAGLAALGIRPGDKVAILAEGSNAWIISELGLFYAGAVSVPLSVKLEESNDLLFRMRHAEVKAVFVSKHQLPKIRRIRAGLPQLEQVIVLGHNNVLETSINANDIPLMRVEEMYLIKAEAEAMSGQDGKKTLEDFIKKYRNESYVVSNSDIQEEVFLQRRIELWGEGLNWFDVMRLNKGVDRRGAGFPNDNMIFNIAPTDPILLWPIPQAEIQANQALSAADQNPTSTTPKPVEDK